MTFTPMKTVTGGEREVFESFLDFHRGVVIGKAAGLTSDVARARQVPSATTLAGLLRHLALNERRWFQVVLAGAPVPLGEREDEPDTSWNVADDDISDLVRAYEQECERSRETAARFALEDTGSHPFLGKVSLRWIYAHMLEETARHAGHADILRELTDGTTGVTG